MPFDRTFSPLNDIKRNIELARSFVTGMNYEQFLKDQKSVYAVVRCLEIVSEASRRLPDELKARHAHIPWTDIAAAGNVYRHGYQLVRDDLLWETVHEGLPPLLVAVGEELARIK
jgi:uncharacterized protein with HEPN domain